MKMTTGKIVALVFGALALMFVVTTYSVVTWGLRVNDRMVKLNENVNGQWGQVESLYQRRNDLIPNLVASVKGYAKHEDSVLVEVAKARASVGQVKVNANNADEITKFEQTQGGLTQALSRLMVVSEQYPELKADKQFQELQSQLEGTENRISTERRKYNEAAQEYNTYIKLAVESVIANYRGFTARPYFKADDGAKTVPKVNF